MGRFYALTHRETPAGTSAAMMSTMNPRRWYALAIGLLVLALAGYLVQANALAAKGYQMESLRQKLDRLRLETLDLESRALELQSFQHLEQRISSLKLVPASDVRYVSAAAGPVSAISTPPAGYE